jgi:biopolymer transport protein ExbD
MARARSKRGSDTLPEPDTLPLMNIIFMLILALLTMAAMLPLGFLSSEAQRLSKGAAAPTEEKKNPLNLIVFITDKGFNFSVRGAVHMGPTDPAQPNRKLSLIPMITAPDGQKEYDYEKLREKLNEYKKIDPAEEAMTITADPEVPFDVIIQTMDWSRFDTSGPEKKPLFPKVSFAAGLVG